MKYSLDEGAQHTHHKGLFLVALPLLLAAGLAMPKSSSNHTTAPLVIRTIHYHPTATTTSASSSTSPSNSAHTSPSSRSASNISPASPSQPAGSAGGGTVSPSSDSGGLAGLTVPPLDVQAAGKAILSASGTTLTLN